MTTTRTDDGPISDAAVAAALRTFVRATRPVLDGLREADPFGLRHRIVADLPAGTARGLVDKLLDFLAAVEVPGTAAWARMDRPQRVHWWVRRVGRFTTAIAAVPGLGGALANKLPVAKAVGTAGQGLLLVAIAGEYGVHAERDVVAMLGAVMFGRDLDTSHELTPDEDSAADAAAAEIVAPLRGQRAITLKRLAGAMWALGRGLFAVEDELDKRPHGRLHHRALGMIPVVGLLGKYLGEWSGLKRAARAAEAWFAAHPQAGGTR